ncbi:beta-carotene hydroxylase 1, chloroplastic-like isoform X2 [Cannabis sativa]|uniref:beta-carotene hydroxylase 1, chloroplastic-like isoform X2 n=1 Tax=Cannabis sativa TaxID=3483 RepID=UPI0029C9FEB6|nr:beta-carotene hydroxylase 1, chloroplastic-like isoform X2 [Cannabis sativa]
MAAGVLTGSGPLTYSFGRKFIPSPKPISKSNSFSFLAQKSNLNRTSYSYSRKQGKGIIIVVLNKKTEDHHAMQVSHDLNTIKLDESKSEAEIIVPRISNDRLARKKIERYTYLVAAVLSSLGVSSAAITAVYFRFSWQMQGGEFPVAEMLVTIFLVIGSAVGMEFWARWAHRALWHASLWHMHESHHRARDGPFEHNDVFAIINAVPAIALLYYGFFNTGLLPGLSFGIRNYSVWDGLHVCARWSSPPSFPGWPHCKCSLFEKSCCSPSISSFRQIWRSPIRVVFRTT